MSQARARFVLFMEKVSRVVHIGSAGGWILVEVFFVIRRSCRTGTQEKWGEIGYHWLFPYGEITPETIR